MDPERWITLLEERAPALRSAGVLSLSVDGASAVLAPMVAELEMTATEQAPAEASAPPADTGELNPLDDPSTFGGVLPGYEIPASVPGAVE